jgi:putative acyl-CoA dehydrogenase
VHTIIEMVNHTRLDCVVGSLGIMRQAVSQAAWHVAHRSAFGATLIDKPLMTNVIADLELEVEAATLMMMRLSGAFDRAVDRPRRGGIPSHRHAGRQVLGDEALHAGGARGMECLGGNGYVEESVSPGCSGSPL